MHFTAIYVIVIITITEQFQVEHHEHRVSLREISELDSPLDRKANLWFNNLAESYNNGDSKPHLTIFTITHALPSYVAMALSAAVDEERINVDEGKINESERKYTRLERYLLSRWADNQLRRFEGKPEQSLPIQAAEFFGAERLLEKAVDHVIKYLRGRLPGIPESETLDNMLAGAAALGVPHLIHSNVVALERAVAVNATAVDPDGLMGVLHDLAEKEAELPKK